MKRHSPAPLLGRSDVGSTWQAVIQFATMNVASSAIAGVGTVPRTTLRGDRFGEDSMPGVDETQPFAAYLEQSLNG